MWQLQAVVYFTPNDLKEAGQELVSAAQTTPRFFQFGTQVSDSRSACLMCVGVAVGSSRSVAAALATRLFIGRPVGNKDRTPNDYPGVLSDS